MPIHNSHIKLNTHFSNVNDFEELQSPYSPSDYSSYGGESGDFFHCEEFFEYLYSTPVSLVLQVAENSNDMRNKYFLHNDPSQVIPKHCIPRFIVLAGVGGWRFVNLGKLGYRLSKDGLSQEMKRYFPSETVEFPPIFGNVVDNNQICVLIAQKLSGVKHCEMDIQIEKYLDGSFGVKLLEFDFRFTMCPFAGGKFLIVSFVPKSTYNEYFQNGLTWFIVDLENNIVDRVHPIVHKIQCQDGVTTVSRKVTEENQDGDLNGGFCNETFNVLNATSPQIFSFRPFPTNPDLFQVHMFFKKEYFDRTDPTEDMEGMFRFFFKLSEEAICRHKNLLTLLVEGYHVDCFIKTVL